MCEPAKVGAMQTMLRPDSKGRIGIDSLARRLRERLGGRPISGYAAEVTDDGTIVLRPRIEVDADEAATMVLATDDRDALLEALAHPPRANARLKAAMRRHHKTVVGA
jgi:hypothetical protein